MGLGMDQVNLNHCIVMLQGSDSQLCIPVFVSSLSLPSASLAVPDNNPQSTQLGRILSVQSQVRVQADVY